MDRLRRELEAERKRRELSQLDLASMIGVNQSDVSQFLAGRWPGMNLATLFRYATGLGLEVEITLKRRNP